MKRGSVCACDEDRQGEHPTGNIVRLPATSRTLTVGPSTRPPPPAKGRSHSRHSCSGQDPFEDGRGAWLTDLTKAGEETLVAEAGRLLELDQVPPKQWRAAWLRQLPNEELVQFATARLGAPDAEVMTEVVRRMREMMRRIGPVLGSMRNAGILPTP
ncbi:hypothetical protein [Streptomyces sp. NPDC002676]